MHSDSDKPLKHISCFGPDGGCEYEEEEIEETDPMKWLTALVGMAIVTRLVLPGNNTRKIIEAHSNAISAMVRVATAPTTWQEDLRSAAEKFHQQAMDAIADFWEGFRE